MEVYKGIKGINPKHFDYIFANKECNYELRNVLIIDWTNVLTTDHGQNYLRIIHSGASAYSVSFQIGHFCM